MELPTKQEDGSNDVEVGGDLVLSDEAARGGSANPEGKYNMGMVAMEREDMDGATQRGQIGLHALLSNP